jgi:hypothetical protein
MNFIGGSDSFRYFKIISVNYKKVKDEGRYKTKGSPGDAAKKAFTQLSKKYKTNKLRFSIKETTQGSSKKEHGPYLGEKIKLKKPLQVKYKGKNKPVIIKYETKIHLVKDCKQKGGIGSLERRTTHKNNGNYKNGGNGIVTNIVINSSLNDNEGGGSNQEMVGEDNYELFNSENIVSCANYKKPEIIEKYFKSPSSYNIIFYFYDFEEKEISIKMSNSMNINNNSSISSGFFFPLLISLNDGTENKFEYSRDLGIGEFGSVIEYNYEGIKLALKIEKDQGLNHPIEQAISNKLRNNKCNIINEKYVGHLKILNEEGGSEETYYYYLMEAGIKNLDEIIKTKDLPLDIFKNIMNDIIQTLTCLINQGIYYTDLKFKNVLVCCHSPTHFRIKLCDLGSAVGANAERFYLPFKYDLRKHFVFPSSKNEKLYYIYWNIGIMYLIFYLIKEDKNDFLQKFTDEILKNTETLSNNYFESLYSRDNINEDHNINKELGNYFDIPNFKYLSLNEVNMNNINILDEPVE